MADGMRLHPCLGLPELGSDPDAQMLTARQQPQHLTYSAAFVRELHTFVSEQLVEAMVRRSAFAGSCCSALQLLCWSQMFWGYSCCTAAVLTGATRVSPMQLLALESARPETSAAPDYALGSAACAN